MALVSLAVSDFRFRISANFLKIELILMLVSERFRSSMRKAMWCAPRWWRNSMVTLSSPKVAEKGPPSSNDLWVQQDGVRGYPPWKIQKVLSCWAAEIFVNCLFNSMGRVCLWKVLEWRGLFVTRQRWWRCWRTVKTNFQTNWAESTKEKWIGCTLVGVEDDPPLRLCIWQYMCLKISCFRLWRQSYNCYQRSIDSFRRWEVDKHLVGGRKILECLQRKYIWYPLNWPCRSLYGSLSVLLCVGSVYLERLIGTNL